MRLEYIGIHTGQHLVRLDEIALVREDLQYPAGALGGDIDFGRFDTAVTAGETFAETAGAQFAPQQRADDGNHGDGRKHLEGGSGAWLTHDSAPAVECAESS